MADEPRKVRVPTTGRRSLMGWVEWDDEIEADPETADHWDARVWLGGGFS